MISTTIKKEYMEAILKGEKKVEYKSINPYWNKRILTRQAYLEILVGKNAIEQHKVINFLCGRKSYKFKIKKITLDRTPTELEMIVGYPFCYHIHLGERIGE
jgi:hypothetical protein